MQFLVVVPSRPPIVNPELFVPVSPTQWILRLERPIEVSQLCVSLLEPLAADDLGLSVAFSIPNATPGEWGNGEFLGALTNNKPSDLFLTRWPWLSDIAQLPFIDIYLAIEPAALLLEKLKVKPPFDLRQELAQKTALNLFRYIESFNESGSQALLQSPSAVLDAWFKRYQEKYSRDNNFVLLTE